MYVDFGSLPYLAPHVRGQDVIEPLQAPPPLDLACGDEVAFVFLPERLSELEWVLRTFPGETEEVSSPAGGSPLFRVHRSRTPCRGTVEEGA